MTKYRVPFVQVASAIVTVEANSKEEALEKAYEEFDYPQTNIHNDFELAGDWEAEADVKWMHTEKEWADQNQVLENSIYEI